MEHTETNWDYADVIENKNSFSKEEVDFIIKELGIIFLPESDIKYYNDFYKLIEEELISAGKDELTLSDMIFETAQKLLYNN